MRGKPTTGIYDGLAFTYQLGFSEDTFGLSNQSQSKTEGGLLRPLSLGLRHLSQTHSRHSSCATAAIQRDEYVQKRTRSLAVCPAAISAMAISPTRRL